MGRGWLRGNPCCRGADDAPRVALLQKRDRAQVVERPIGAEQHRCRHGRRAIPLYQRADRPEDANDRGVPEGASAVLTALDVRDEVVLDDCDEHVRPAAERQRHADAHVQARPVPSRPYRGRERDRGFRYSRRLHERLPDRGRVAADGLKLPVDDHPAVCRCCSCESRSP